MMVSKVAIHFGLNICSLECHSVDNRTNEEYDRKA